MESSLAMLAFVRAVECHGFTAAAHDLGVTPSAVSKLVTRLERRLGVIRLSDIIVGPAIRSGRLVPILLDEHQPEPLPVNAVYTPTRRRPPKVDGVIQFLVEKFSSVPWRLPHPTGESTASGARKVRRAR